MGKNRKYIFVVGGVMSGVGKGITTSSIGHILQARGLKVNLVKVDPYLNVDAGTMNPTEHGEVFVMGSGLETDQDMGNYERFLDMDLFSEDYMTSGMIYKEVIDKERNLGFKGKCVEAVPHIRDAIVDKIVAAGDKHKSDITVVEIGGTIGDYQNIMFIEAARVMRLRNPDDVKFVMVSYLPVPSTLGEMKTRPTQHAVQQLNSYGVQTDIIIARSSIPLDDRRKEKIAVASNVLKDHVISAPDIKSIYDVPLNFENDKLGDILLKLLHLHGKPFHADLSKWKKFVEKVNSVEGEVNIAIVGKYFNTGDFVLSDAYLSVIEAIKFSAYYAGVKPNITWLSSQDFESNTCDMDILTKYDGIVIPGGFGETGIEGKLKVIQCARENNIPYFGLCYGLQLMMVEYARNVMGIPDANTVEIDPDSPDPIVDVMPDQKNLIKEGKYGGTMRLGNYPAVLKKGTIAYDAYGKKEIVERHRHRYEINPEYVEKLEEAGIVFSGTSPDGVLMEIGEVPKNKFHLGTQFHPELLARPLSPHPLFDAFIKAAIEKK